MSTQTGRTAPSPSSDEVVTQRYGASRSRSFTGKLVVLIFVAMLIAVVFYMVQAFRHATNADVSAVESGGTIVSDDRLQLRVDVTRNDPGKEAFCIVTALDYDKNEVGRREFYIPAGGDKVSRFTVDINTRHRGHAGKVYGCSSTVPAYLKRG